MRAGFNLPRHAGIAWQQAGLQQSILDFYLTIPPLFHESRRITTSVWTLSTKSLQGHQFTVRTFICADFFIIHHKFDINRQSCYITCSPSQACSLMIWVVPSAPADKRHCLEWLTPVLHNTKGNWELSQTPAYHHL